MNLMLTGILSKEKDKFRLDLEKRIVTYNAHNDADEQRKSSKQSKNCLDWSEKSKFTNKATNYKKSDFIFLNFKWVQ